MLHPCVNQDKPDMTSQRPARSIRLKLINPVSNKVNRLRFLRLTDSFFKQSEEQPCFLENVLSV